MLKQGKTKAVVSYQPIFGLDGTVYRKIIRVPRRIMDYFVSDMFARAEVHYTKKDGIWYWLNKPIVWQGDTAFLNTTQGDVFKDWLLRQDFIEVNERRLAYEHNTAVKTY